MADEILFADVRRHPDGRTATVVVGGEWDITTDGNLVDRLGPLIEDGYSRLILDARRVSFCDSVCVGALARLHQLTTGHGGWLRLVAAGPAVTRTVELAGLNQVITVYPNPAEALDAA